MPTISTPSLAQGSPSAADTHRHPIPVPVTSSPVDPLRPTSPTVSSVVAPPHLPPPATDNLSVSPSAVPFDTSPTPTPIPINTSHSHSNSTATTAPFSGSLVGSISRRPRRSLATLAHKTSSAFASFSGFGGSTSSSLRSVPSSGSLSKHSRQVSQLSSGEVGNCATPLTPPLSDRSASSEQLTLPAPIGLSSNSDSSLSEHPSTIAGKRSNPALSISEESPVDQNPNDPAGPFRKMHQTSSRLLRMTENDRRPYTKVRIAQQRRNVGQFLTYGVGFHGLVFDVDG